MFQTGLTLSLIGLIAGCGGNDPAPLTTPSPPTQPQPPSPQQQPLIGGPFSTLLVSEAWFYKDAEDRLTPGPARLEIWRDTPEGWVATRLEDGDSNVFHKALMYNGSIITIGAEGANLKTWSFTEGTWSQQTLWQKSWSGRYNRLRDIEIGDVDGDGRDEFVLATHDAGVIAVYNPDENTALELDERADTFVHEIELGDIDGDGTLEFFATPSDRNRANSSQRGELVMYRHDGEHYQRHIVDSFDTTHAKEILTVDLNADGKSELFAVIEAQTDANRRLTSPVEIRQYDLQSDGTFTHTVIATINDRMTRFLVPGDFDSDGSIELIAATMSTGLWLIKPIAAANGTQWQTSLIDADSSGFEHACYPADLDGDGTPELIVASDNQQELRTYRWNGETQRFDKTLIGRLADTTITWNITHGRL